jgi:thiol-disulfide isomerase/thioredoxin
MSQELIQKLLLLIPILIFGTIIFTPFLCFFLYKRKKMRACIIFSYIWFMVSFCLLGIFIKHTVGRHQERMYYADKASHILRISEMLRAGQTEKSIMYLDDYLSQTLYYTAYDISDAKMGRLNPDILSVWQEVKEYFDTYEVNEPYTGSMIPLFRQKLSHVPWSEMQLAITKFEKTYGNTKTAIAPAINIESWITPRITTEQLKNKVILLDFWNIGCSPCVKSLPKLQEIHDKYKDQGLLVIACAGGDKQKTKEFLEKDKYSFPAGMETNQMYLDYAVRGNPTYFLIDRNGYLAWGPEHRLPTDNELINLLNAR